MIKRLLWKCFLLINLFALNSVSTVAQNGLDTIKVYINLDSALANPDEVIRLNLERSKFKSLPESILHFKNLRELNLNSNKLKNIPPWLSQLDQLERLYLSKNKIEEFPAIICEIKTLKLLVLSRNDLYEFPACFGDLVNLEALDIWETNVASFPIEVENLKKLKLLDMRAIQMNENEQGNIRALLPADAEINFSEPCDCNFGE